ncbi:MAG TPA: hypothetical protein VH142_13820 [Polyangiaceae bacterium]|nr:hypothetical protein [Polyangiaceae bacterium]
MPPRWMEAALVVLFAAAPAGAAGTWVEAPPNPTTGGQAFALWLMTDGTVLSHGSQLNNWVILSPDKTGDYSKGTWKSVASSAYSRGGAQEHVLKDGRFFEAGGEYIYAEPGCSSNCAQPGNGSPLFKNAEIYDPVANTWTVEAPGLYEIADTGSATLADGRVFSSCRTSSQTQIYDPTANKWTPAAPTLLGTGDENSWASLQNGGVLAVGYQSAGAAVYDPATDKWTRTGPVPSGFNLGDTSGISQMFDGRVLVYGLGQLYIYTPGPTPTDPGTWALGPKTLMNYEAEDEYSDTLPNGKVWSGLVSMTYGPGLVLEEFDPTTNMVTSVPPAPDRGNPYPIDYVNLPNGQVMITAEQNDWIYTPDSPPDDSWRPTVTSVVFDGGSTYTLTGTQISGLINGADEGDDMTMAENYPIVSLKDEGGNVYYCRSFNFSNMMPSKGSTPETCQFMTPPDLPQGSYSLYVSAVGVPSKDPVTFTAGVGTAPGNPGSGGSSSTDGGTSTPSGGATNAGGAPTSSGGATSGGASNDGSGGFANTSGGASSFGGTVAASGGAAGSGGFATTSTGATAGSGGGTGSSGDSSSCGCKVPSRSSRTTGWAGLAWLLGLGAWMRRRSKVVKVRANTR